ncbi:MAG: glycosyltransferase family 4 protein [Rhizomicrobium sp.]
MASAGKRPGVLIIVQNLPVPFDARVWQESTTLTAAGYDVSVICPKGKGYTAAHEVLDGVNIYRHDMPFEANSAVGFLVEYAVALFHETRLAWRVLFRHGFTVVHACNPPDLIFLVALPFKLLGKKFVFDQHDIVPELFEAKFARRGFFYWLLRMFERMTFACANISIATNGSYREIAVGRGGMKPDRVFVVRSGPKLERLRLMPPDAALRRGRRYLVGYLGVIGTSEGLDGLLQGIDHIVNKRGRKDVQFVIVGGGPELENIQRMAGEMGLADDIIFTGRVSDEELLRWLNTADVCVNADAVNTMNDLSTMNKIVEYMALGKPIVQFDLREGRVSAGESSLYAKANDWEDFGDKVIALLDDPAKREAMGAFGRRRVETELAWQYEAPKLLAAYARVAPVAGTARTPEQPGPIKSEVS